MKRIGSINPKRRTLYLVIISIVAIFMATGYSILTERLTIKGSTNLYASDNYLWKKIIKDYGVNTNSGLIESPYENNKYAYSGSSANNYITFNGNEVWRILSIESDNTIKIANLNANINIKFDENNTEAQDGFYCTDLGTEGCNAWHKRSALNNASYYGEVLYDSTVNNYLNTTYYNSLDSTSKSLITNHDFGIGSVPSNTVNNSDFEGILQYEISDTWNGNIGMINLSDIALSVTPGTGNSYIIGSFSGNKIIWFMNPVYDSNTRVWAYNPSRYEPIEAKTNIKTETRTYQTTDEYNYYAIPTLYLKGTVEYDSGNGTIENPFVIKTQ